MTWSELLRRGDECRTRQPVPSPHNNICTRDLQNRNSLPSVSSESFKSQEIVMTSFQHRMLHIAATAAAMAASSLSATAAFASQGPGGGPGTAGGFTRLAMAIIVYGLSAVIVGVGLIGAARQRSH
jgi:hypothetical protein